jgi:hypothetical protein
LLLDLGPFPFLKRQMNNKFIIYITMNYWNYLAFFSVLLFASVKMHAAPFSTFDYRGIIEIKKKSFIWESSGPVKLQAKVMPGSDLNVSEEEFGNSLKSVIRFGKRGGALLIDGNPIFENASHSWIALIKPKSPDTTRMQVILSAGFREGLNRSDYAWGGFIDDRGINAFARSEIGMMVAARSNAKLEGWQIVVATYQVNSNLRIRVIPLDSYDFDPDDVRVVNYRAAGPLDAVPIGSEIIVIGATSHNISNLFHGDIASILFYNYCLHANRAWVNEVRDLQLKYSSRR